MTNNFDFAGEYYKWVKDNTIVNHLSTNWTEIITPFLDINNDFITIYLKKRGNKILISDDGYTINNLSLNLKSKKISQAFEEILSNYEIHYEQGELFTKIDISDFALKNQMFLQAIVAINGISYLDYNNKSDSQEIFVGKVVDFFFSNKLTFKQNFKIVGKSGFEYKIDFWIPAVKEKSKSAKLIKAINTPREDYITSAIFTLNDINSTMNNKVQLAVFLNDKNKSIDNKFNVAIKTYNGILIPWTKRNNFINELSIA